MENFTLIINNESSDLQLSELTLKEDYRKKWNVTENNFLVLTKNGKLINNSIYRKGGLNNFDLKRDKYFMLLKYQESYLSKDIIKITKSKDNKYLKSSWCIIDNNGIEKVVFEPFDSPYLVKNSCIYHINGNYYNIETNVCYCYVSGYIESTDFLFLENNFDKDHTKRGVMKIDKITGEYEIFRK